MSLGGSRSRLTALTRDLSAHWRLTRESWNDAKAEEFERLYLKPLLASVDRAALALEQLDEVVIKARKDCEPSSGA